MTEITTCGADWMDCVLISGKNFYKGDLNLEQAFQTSSIKLHCIDHNNIPVHILANEDCAMEQLGHVYMQFLPRMMPNRPKMIYKIYSEPRRHAMLNDSNYNLLSEPFESSPRGRTRLLPDSRMSLSLEFKRFALN